MHLKHRQTNEITHLALAQFFSWCSIYEKPFSTKELIIKMNDLVTDEISITNIDGTLIGKEKFLQRLLILHKLQNAHHIKKVNVKMDNEQTIIITADAMYQNVMPDFSSNSYSVKWFFEMIFFKEYLPKIKSLKVNTIEILENVKFSNNYHINRTLSFIHYWLFLFNYKKENLQEAFSSNVEFKLEGNETMGIHDFSLWAEQKIFHNTNNGQPKNFYVHEKHNNEIFAFFNLEMETNDNKLINTKHEWVLSNVCENQFPKIIKMSIIEGANS